MDIETRIPNKKKKKGSNRVVEPYNPLIPLLQSIDTGCPSGFVGPIPSAGVCLSIVSNRAADGTFNATSSEKLKTK